MTDTPFCLPGAKIDESGAECIRSQAMWPLNMSVGRRCPASDMRQHHVAGE